MLCISYLSVCSGLSLLVLLLDAFACLIGSSFLNKVLLFILLLFLNHLELLLLGLIKNGKWRLIDARLELGEQLEHLQHHSFLGQDLWIPCIAEFIIELDLDASRPAKVTRMHLVLNEMTI